MHIVRYFRLTECPRVLFRHNFYLPWQSLHQDSQWQNLIAELCHQLVTHY